MRGPCAQRSRSRMSRAVPPARPALAAAHNGRPFAAPVPERGPAKRPNGPITPARVPLETTLLSHGRSWSEGPSSHHDHPRATARSHRATTGPVIHSMRPRRPPSAGPLPPGDEPLPTDPPPPAAIRHLRPPFRRLRPPSQPRRTPMQPPQTDCQPFTSPSAPSVRTARPPPMPQARPPPPPAVTGLAQTDWAPTDPSTTTTPDDHPSEGPHRGATTAQTTSSRCQSGRAGGLSGSSAGWVGSTALAEAPLPRRPSPGGRARPVGG